jgi:putative transposase
VAYPLSDRQREELMQERGVAVDPSTINRWGLQYSPQLAAAFHRRKRLVSRSWRLDATYIRVRGRWRYLYRAVDKTGQTIASPLTTQRNRDAASRFLRPAIPRHGLPETVTIGGSGANAAAIQHYNTEHRATIVLRQVRSLNNVVEQAHRAVKRLTRPLLGFNAFDAAQRTLAGVELMHRLRKRQWGGGVEQGRTVAEQSYALAA